MTDAYIDSLSFSILSPDIVRSLARVRIVTSDLYDADGYPVEGGVMDPRLGVIDPGLHCRTCGGGIGDCPGHFGYLELAKPVVNVLYTKLVYQLLKLHCRKCGRLMLLEKSVEKTQTMPSKCPHCKAPQKKISIVKPYSFYEDKTELTPELIRDKFEKIPTSDLKKVGFNGGRPEWLILTLFPIPPVTMRPSITLEGGERSEDDLTHKLVDIVRINQSLRENIDIGAPEFILNDLWELVQYHVSTYFDNELTGVPLARHRSGRALKGLTQRLKAKEGRMRGNLLGKRVNFSARTVISPDPMLSINEVGVPEIVANELTIPMHVTAMNIKEIRSMLKGESVNYVMRPDGRRLKVLPDNKKDLIENIGEGWVIDRRLKENDIVLFNRQPSLHRVSIMAHRVRIMPYRTFRMNPSVCPPFNADFDGDEMNLHALQTEEARTEAAFLMEVQKNIISPKFGGPIVGLDLDQISGIYLLTKKGTVIGREETSQLFSNANIEIDLPDGDSFTGKQIFNLLLPKNLDIAFKANACRNCENCLREDCKHDAWVDIKKGVLKTGVIDSKAVGAFKGKIISKINTVSDHEEVKRFINRCGRLGVSFLMLRGFSLGISDLDLTQKIKKDIENEVNDAKDEAELLIEKYKKKELKILPGLTAKNSLEAQIMNALASGISRVSDIVADNIKQSDILVMSQSGAKGSIVNTTQMTAVVGQETILGKRIKRGYYHRTLPHIKRGDLSPMSHGFVEKGFKEGLSPFEFFWNIMNGREGLMDKSLRTRKSGYMQRRLVNALQDLKVSDDGTVRTANNELVQFMAGEDGIDPSKSDWGVLDWKERMKGVK
jgi:DNA-directed RNA polymerase subunit A'